MISKWSWSLLHFNTLECERLHGLRKTLEIPKAIIKSKKANKQDQAYLFLIAITYSGYSTYPLLFMSSLFRIESICSSKCFSLNGSTFGSSVTEKSLTFQSFKSTTFSMLKIHYDQRKMWDVLHNYQNHEIKSRSSRNNGKSHNTHMKVGSNSLPLLEIWLSQCLLRIARIWPDYFLPPIDKHQTVCG